MKRIVKTSFLLLFLLSVMIACKQEATPKELLRAVKVKKTTLIHQSASNITLPASVNEFRETKLSFRVGGPLIVLNDVIGSYVKEGEVIAKIDKRDFEIAVEATETRYKLSKAEYKRYKNLVEKGSVSKSIFDQVEAQHKLAKADYESASNALRDTEIKAPFSGYINQVFVNNFETVAPGYPIISLLDMSKYEINAWISVKDAFLLTNTTNYVCIVNQNGKDIRIEGKLKEIGNKTSISKQSLPITIVINSSDQVKLRAGMTTYLEISSGDVQSASSIQVPISSIFTKDNNTKVWIYNEQTNSVSAREVVTGRLLDSGMEIIKGLSENETIVTAGANSLFEGQKVKKMKEVSNSNIGNKL